MTVSPPHRSTTRWNLLRTALIWIYRGPVHNTGRGAQKGMHGLAAWYFLKGSGSVEIDGVTTSASASEWLLVKPAPRIQSFSADAEILSIRFQAAWPDGSSMFDEGLSHTLNDKTYPELKESAEALEQAVAHYAPTKAGSLEFIFEGIDFPAHILIEQKFLSWLLAYYDALVNEGLQPNRMEIRDTRVLEAVGILQNWPLEELFVEERFALKFGLSKHQLERLIVAEIGVTSRQFIDGRRIKYAKERLGLGLESIKEIGYKTGFKHSSSFCNWFKKRTGFNPSFFHNLGERT